MNLILALRYAVLDLKRGSAALAFCLACLFLGVTGITGVQVLSRDLTAGIQSDGQRILGGDFAISGYAPLNATVLDRLKTLGTISQVVDSRAMLLNQHKEKTSLVDLKAVDAAYPLFGAVTVLDNSAPITQLLSFENGTHGALMLYCV
jgi:putative ABC transport system permease protein